MEIKLRGRWVTSLLVLGFLVGSSGLAQATLVDFHTAVAGEANLRNHYTFDGVDDTARLSDSGSASKTLSVQSGTATYTPGFGSSTAANIGAFDGYRTFGNAFTESTRVEYLINPSDTATNGTFIAAAFIGGGTGNPSGRLYFGKPSNGALKMTIGPNSDTTIIDAADYTVGHWYYVAVGVVESGGDWVANAWYADLTDSHTTLTHSVNGIMATADSSLLPATGDNFGVGRGMFPGTSGFLGLLDELTVYDRALTGADLQGHLDAILVAVPEPSAFLFMGMASLLVVRGSSRRRKD